MHSPLLSKSPHGSEAPYTKVWLASTIVLGFFLGWGAKNQNTFPINEISVSEPGMSMVSTYDPEYFTRNNYEAYGEAGQTILAKFKPGAVKLVGPPDSPRWMPANNWPGKETAVGDAGKMAVAMCIDFGKCCNYPEVMAECISNLKMARPQNVVSLDKHFCPMRPYLKWWDRIDFVIYMLRLAGSVIDLATGAIPIITEIKGIVNLIKDTVSELTGFDIWLPVKKFFNCFATPELSVAMDQTTLRSTLGLLKVDKSPRPGDLINYYFMLGLASTGNPDAKPPVPARWLSFKCRIIYALRFGFLPAIFGQIKGDKVLSWIFEGSGISKLFQYIVKGITNFLGPLGKVFSAIMDAMSSQSTGIVPTPEEIKGSKELTGSTATLFAGGTMMGQESGPIDDFAKTGLGMYFKDMRKKINNVMQGITGSQERFKELGKTFVHDAELAWNDVVDYWIDDFIAPMLFGGIFWYCDKQRDPALMGGEPLPKFFDKQGTPVHFIEQVQKDEKNAACKGKRKFTVGSCYGTFVKSLGFKNDAIPCNKDRGETYCFKNRCVCKDGYATPDGEKCVKCESIRSADTYNEESVSIVHEDTLLPEVEEEPIAEIPSELTDEEWAKLSYEETWEQMRKEVDMFSAQQTGAKRA